MLVSACVEMNDLDQAITVWNADGDLVAHLATDQANDVVGFSPTGDKLFAGPFLSGSLKMWELNVGQGIDGEIIWKPTLVSNKHSDWAVSGVWEADGLYIITEPGDNQDFHLWDMTSGEALFSVENDGPSTYLPN